MHSFADNEFLGCVCATLLKKKNDSGHYNLPNKELLRHALAAVDYPQQEGKIDNNKYNEFTPEEKVLKERKSEFLKRSRGYRTKQ